MDSLAKRIIAFNAPLIAENVKIKYRIMAENIFSFYRGACHLFYEDLRSKIKKLPSSPLCWICGDLHIENFGSYKAANQLVYFDLNDFDEAMLAPALWDVVRMITSILVAFYALKIQQKKARNMSLLFLRTYAEVLAKGKAEYIEPKIAKGIACTFLKAVSERKQKDLIEKRTIVWKKKRLLYVNTEKHMALDKALKKKLMLHISHWIANSSDGPYNYKVKDVVFRLAGTGSIGVKRYLFLLQNRKDKNDFFLLDMKEERASSLKPYLPTRQPKWKSEADRVKAIAYRMQSRLPAQFSTTVFEGDSYILEEMQPTSDKVNFELIKNRYRDVYQVINDMALLTASAQLRSGGRQGSACADELISFGKKYKKWSSQIVDYSDSYLQQVKKDFKIFREDYKKGVFD